MVNSTTRPAGARRWLWLGLIVLMVALVVWFWPRGAGKLPGPGFRMGAAATPVAVASLTEGHIDRTLQALGTVTPLHTVTIRARVDGPLQSLNFDDGQIVHAGDVLAVIDPRPFEIELRRAQGQQMQHAAQLANARVDLARYEKLAKQDSIARQQVDAARAQVRELEGQAKIDQAAVEDAQLQLSYTKITAPLDGRLGLHRLDVGNMVHASDTDGLVVLTQSRPIDVLYSIPQTELGSLLPARAARPALPTQLLSGDGTVLAEGVLQAVDNQIDAATGTVQLKSRFDNEDSLLFPGQFVRVRLKLGLEEGLLVPLRAVQRGSMGEYVYRVGEDDKAHVVAITTGVDDGRHVVVESGLEPGDRVVIEGTDRLRDGSDVEVVEPADSGDGAESAGMDAQGGGQAGSDDARGPAS